MKIELTNWNIVNLINVLDKFSATKGKIGHSIAATRSNLEEAILPFIRQRNELLAEYGKEVEDGRHIIDKDSEHYDEYMNKFTKIAENQVEVEINQIPKTDFNYEDLYGDDVTVRDYKFIEEIFVER